MNKKTGLYIGRFQPFHKGHLNYILQIAKEADRIIIGIGSSQYSRTIENPFSADERRMMIELSVKKSLDDYVIVNIPDIHDYSRWVEHVEKLCPEFDIAYTGNQIVKTLLEEKGYKVLSPKGSRFISASQIRDMISKNQDWQKFVPPEVIHVINTIKGVDRIKRIYRSERERFPRTAVDVIIELYNHEEKFKGIVLVNRKYAPNGMAMPGGMQEYGEAIETTAKREIKEETGLEIIALEPLEFRSNPNRDPRGHVNSMVFIGKAYGKPRAGSDAKNVFVLKPKKINNKFKRQLVFDHAEIWENYLKKGRIK